MAIGKPLLVQQRKSVQQPVLSTNTRELSTNIKALQLPFADYSIAQNNALASHAVGKELANMVSAGVSAKINWDNQQDEFERLTWMDEWQKSDLDFKGRFAKAVTPDQKQTVLTDYDANLQELTDKWSEKFGTDLRSKRYLTQLRSGSQKQYSTFHTNIAKDIHTRAVSMHEVNIASALQSLKEDRNADPQIQMENIKDAYSNLLKIGHYSVEEAQFRLGIAKMTAVTDRAMLFARGLAGDTAATGQNSYSRDDLLLRLEQTLGFQKGTLDSKLARKAEGTYTDHYYKKLAEHNAQVNSDENYKKHLTRKMFHRFQSDKKQALDSGVVGEVEAEKLYAKAKALEATGYPGEVASLEAEINSLKYNPADETTVLEYTTGDGWQEILQKLSGEDSTYLDVDKIDDIVQEKHPFANIKTRNAIRNYLIKWNENLTKDFSKATEPTLRSSLAHYIKGNQAVRTFIASNVQDGFGALINPNTLNWKSVFQRNKATADALSRIESRLAESAGSHQGPFAKEAQEQSIPERQAILRAFIDDLVNKEFDTLVKDDLEAQEKEKMEMGILGTHMNKGLPKSSLPPSQKQNIAQQLKDTAPYTQVSNEGIKTSDTSGKVVDISKPGAMTEAMQKGAKEQIGTVTQGLKDDVNQIKAVGKAVQSGLKNMIRSKTQGIREGARDFKETVRQSETGPETLNRLATEGVEVLNEGIEALKKPTGAQSPISEAGKKLAGEPPKPISAPTGTPQERYQAFEDAENFAIQSTEKLLSGMESVEQEESQMTREESAENAANYLENIGQANQPEQGQSMIPQAPVTIPPNIVEAIPQAIEQINQIVQPPAPTLQPNVTNEDSLKQLEKQYNIEGRKKLRGIKDTRIQHPPSTTPLNLQELPIADQTDRAIWDRATEMYQLNEDFKEHGIGREATWEEKEELDLLLKEIKRRKLTNRQMQGKGLWEPVDTGLHDGDMFSFLAKNYNASSKLLKSDEEEKKFAKNARQALENYYDGNLSPEQKTNVAEMLSVLDEAKWSFADDLGYLGMSYETFTDYMIAVYGAETQFGTDTPVSKRDVVGELQVTRGTFRDVTKPKGNLGPKMAEAMGYTIENLRKLAKNDSKLKYSLLNSKKFNYLAGAAIVLNKLQYNPKGKRK